MLSIADHYKRVDVLDSGIEFGSEKLLGRVFFCLNDKRIESDDDVLYEPHRTALGSSGQNTV